MKSWLISFKLAKEMGKTKIAYKWTRTHNHLLRKRTLNHLAKLAK